MADRGSDKGHRHMACRAHPAGKRTVWAQARGCVRVMARGWSWVVQQVQRQCFARAVQ